MPTIGSRMTPFGAGISSISPSVQLLELREVVRHHQPFARGRPPVHLVGVAGHRLRGAPSAAMLCDLDRDDHHRRPAGTRCARRAPSARARRRESPRAPAAIVAGNRIVRIDDVLRRHDEQIGVERRLHPVDDRRVARARHAGERDDQRERQHQRGDARRRPARRLNQAVGRQRAFDRPQPLQQRPQRSARAPATAAGSSSSADDDRQHVAGVEHGPRAADRRGRRSRPRRARPPSDRAHAALAGRQHLILALLQRLHRIDARRVPRRNHGGDDARRDADRQRQREQRRDWSRARRRAARRRRRRRSARRSTPRSPRAISTPKTRPPSDPTSPVTALSPRNSQRICRARRAERPQDADLRSPLRHGDRERVVDDEHPDEQREHARDARPSSSSRRASPRTAGRGPTAARPGSRDRAARRSSRCALGDRAPGLDARGRCDRTCGRGRTSSAPRRCP